MKHINQLKLELDLLDLAEKRPGIYEMIKYLSLNTRKQLKNAVCKVEEERETAATQTQKWR